jgi:hypothetical protein
VIRPVYSRAKYRVSRVEHTHYFVAMDCPNKDDFHHRESGAHAVFVSSGVHWAMLHEVEGRIPSFRRSSTLRTSFGRRIREPSFSHAGSAPTLSERLQPDAHGIIVVASDLISEIGQRETLRFA